MARSTQPGGGAGTIWMIVFAALWLTSTVFLVILYTGQEDLRNEAARAQSAYRRVISPAEEKSVALAKSAQEGGPTVVGLLEEARGQSAVAATGEPTDDVAGIRKKRDEVLRTIQSDSLVPKADAFQDLSLHEALTRLYESFKAELDLRQAAEDRATQLEGEAAQYVEASAKQKDDFEKRAKETVQQLAQCESDRSTYRGDRDKVVEKLEREFEDGRKRNDVELTKERQARAAAEKRLVDLQRRLAAQQERLGDLLIGPEKLATARQPDGKVLTAVPGDDAVYVNLGRRHGLVLGLQFAVYSSQTGIPEDGRGKAQVEVVSIGESSSECGIVSVSGNQVIVANDLIANPVFDPDRPLTFVVLGEFDLDRDGNLDRDGAGTLEALITNWGGKVAGEVTPLTDFLVLGAAPRRPKSPAEAGAAGSAPAAAPSDPTAIAWNRYNEISDQAKTMSVPTLTQDVFLNFLGYGGRRYVGR